MGVSSSEQVTFDRPTLVVFPGSHFCEKAKWALEANKVSFSVMGVVPLFQKSYGDSVPVLLIPNESSIIESDDIMKWAFDKGGVLPFDSAYKEMFDRLGVETRRLAYHYILPNKEIAMDLLSPLSGSVTVPNSQRSFLSLIYFLLAPLMRLGMDIGENQTNIAKDFISEAFIIIEKLLQNSSDNYLSGSTFSTLDIILCSLISPIVLPPELELYSRCYDSLSLEDPYKIYINEIRQSIVGQYVLRVYATHRN